MVMSRKVTRPITASAYNQFTVSISAWRVFVWQRETTVMVSCGRQDVVLTYYTTDIVVFKIYTKRYT